ncbi:MAG: hypothetical protein H6738_24125 [Alphaproteobacteria bacterium]|nr:hypothetical protein [Alphaproteobacteria bacterium]
MGTAQVLGQFHVSGDVLVVELAHVDGGGEGILLAIWSLASRLAAEWGLAEVEWLVHAVWCAHPNGRLRELMVRRGFVVVEHPEVGPVYHLRRSVTGRRVPCLPEGAWQR